jgi:environmental stress-induced protein Ves
MATLLRLRPGEYERTRWKNGGGWTTQIAREPPGSGDFRWRVSIAEIEHDGPFSSFPGVDRDLVLLDGEGIELDIGAAPTRFLGERLAQLRFDGGEAVHCRLIDGATRDFNVMTLRGAVRADVVARPLVGSMVLFPEARTLWLAYLHAGHAEARSGDQRVSLRNEDTLRVDFGDAAAPRQRVVIDGTGEVVLVKLQPAA